MKVQAAPRHQRRRILSIKLQGAGVVLGGGDVQALGLEAVAAQVIGVGALVRVQPMGHYRRVQPSAGKGKLPLLDQLGGAADEGAGNRTRRLGRGRSGTVRAWRPRSAPRRVCCAGELPGARAQRTFGSRPRTGRQNPLPCSTAASCPDGSGLRHRAKLRLRSTKPIGGDTVSTSVSKQKVHAERVAALAKQSLQTHSCQRRQLRTSGLNRR